MLEKWYIDTNHGWLIRATNNSRGELYGACSNIKIMIGNINDEQNFFIQNMNLLIFGQPYIRANIMETRVLGDGSAYANLRSRDEKSVV